jgi:hypothetical protein
MVKLIRIFLFLGVLLGVNSWLMADDWELVKDKEGIQVFTRSVAGSEYKAFRGVAVIDAELNQLMALLDDTAGFVHWMYKCKKPKLLYKVSLLERYQYLGNDFPWPATDREMILRNEISQNPETRVVTVKLSGVVVENLPKQAQLAMPTKTDAVRVPEVSGFYELSPLAGNQTKLIFQLHLDPGGGLPASLVNSQIVDNPFETLKAMRSRVKRPEYANFNPF